VGYVEGVTGNYVRHGTTTLGCAEDPTETASPLRQRGPGAKHHPRRAGQSCLVKRRRRRHGHAEGTSLSLVQKPHELWSTDYKGEFLPGNQKYC
jgi:hypothetical protein